MQVRHNSKSLRNDRIYREYLDMMRDDDKMKYISKSYLYSLLAEKYFLDETSVAKIIQKKIRDERCITA